MNRKNKKLLIGIIIVLFSVISLALVYNSGGFKTLVVPEIPSNVKLAIPHNGAYFCTSVGTGNPSYAIPSSGLWISKSSIGVYTDQVTSLNVYVPGSFWDSWLKNYFGGGIRADIKVCGANQDNCVTQTPQKLTYAGTTTLNLPFTSFNPQTTSVYITMQSRYTILSSWKNDANINANSKVNYAFTKYGLKYVSTTGNPAGSLFIGCESSCDLTCPEQKSRDDAGLIYTSQNSLKPTESVPVLEYWEDLNIDLNSQMGAIIYDGNQFCFGGAIYTKGSINLDNGNTFIYPQMATRRNVECCNGAVISTSYEDKTCTNNKWITVTKDTRLKCVSDFNCPGQGQSTCQNKILSGYHCGSDGYCQVQPTKVSVNCCSQVDCPTDQTCQNNNCVGGAVNKPINLTGNESIIGVNYCPSCDAYAKSLLLGTFMPSQKCEKTLTKNSVICVGSILKLFAVPFFFILSLLFSVQIITKIMKGKYKVLVWILSIISALLVGYMTYILFWWGFWIFILYLIIRIGINFIPGYKFIK